MNASRAARIVVVAGAIGAAASSAKTADAQALQWVQKSPGQYANWIAVLPSLDGREAGGGGPPVPAALPHSLAATAG